MTIFLTLLSSTILSQDLITKIDTTKDISFETVDFDKITLSKKDRVVKTNHDYYKYAVSSSWLKAVEDEFEIGDFWHWAAINERAKRNKEREIHQLTLQELEIKIEESSVCRNELYETEDILIDSQKMVGKLENKVSRKNKELVVVFVLGVALGVFGTQ